MKKDTLLVLGIILAFIVVAGVVAVMGAKNYEPADEEIEGVVVDQDGRGVANATVTLKGAGEHAEEKTATTNETGHFAFEELAKGDYVLSAAKADYIFTDIDVYVPVENAVSHIVIHGEAVARIPSDENATPA